MCKPSIESWVVLGSQAATGRLVSGRPPACCSRGWWPVLLAEVFRLTGLLAAAAADSGIAAALCLRAVGSADTPGSDALVTLNKLSYGFLTGV